MRGLLVLCLCLLLSASSFAAGTRSITLASGKTVDWPPQVGKPYPELELVDANGKTVHLTDFRGKVIIVEPIGMTCPACNSFAGGEKKGGMKGIELQSGLASIEEAFPRYAGGLTLDDDRIVFVNLLLYNLDMKGPTQEDAALWAEHFGLKTRKNTYVLAGGPELIGPESYALIPGFQLIDKDFVLRSDATGDNPRESLWQTLLPLVPKLVAEEAPTAR